jgi:hypothetical protein
VVVGEGSGFEVVSVGFVSAGVFSDGVVVVGLIPMVGFGGRVGFISMAVVSVGKVVLFFGEQLARAALAAMVAVSLMNVRREIGCRRFISYLRR